MGRRRRRQSDAASTGLGSMKIRYSVTLPSRTRVRVTAGASSELPDTATGPGAPRADYPAHKNSDWSYAWVPVLGPLLGGVLAGLVAHLVF